MLVFGAFEKVALDFRKNCSETLEVLNMPVPFAYFHATRILLLSALLFLGYALVEVEEATEPTLAKMIISLVVYSVISGIMSEHRPVLLCTQCLPLIHL